MIMSYTCLSQKKNPSNLTFYIAPVQFPKSQFPEIRSRQRFEFITSPNKEWTSYTTTDGYQDLKEHINNFQIPFLIHERLEVFLINDLRLSLAKKHLPGPNTRKFSLYYKTLELFYIFYITYAYIYA